MIIPQYRISKKTWKSATINSWFGKRTLNAGKKRKKENRQEYTLAEAQMIIEFVF